AGDPFLELLAEGATSAEDQRLDRAHGEAEDLGDLLVGAALELAHDERGALVEGEVAERTPDVLGGDRVLFDDRLGQLFVQLDLGGPALRLAEALAADVVRDRDQPVLRGARALTALEGAVGVEEGRLGDVLGVGLVAQDDERVAVDVACVFLVQALEGAVRALARQNWRHALKDAAFAQFLHPAEGLFQQRRQGRQRRNWQRRRLNRRIWDRRGLYGQLRRLDRNRGRRGRYGLWELRWRRCCGARLDAPARGLDC